MNKKWCDPSNVDERPTTMADSGVDTEKIARLAKMAEAARLGGKGSIRRKHAPVHIDKTSSAQDDKRHSGGERALQQVGEGKWLSWLLVLCNLDCIVFCSMHT